MKHENRLLSVLKRDVLGTALITGLPTAGLLAVSGGIDSIVYSALGSLYVVGMTVSEGVSAYKRNEVKPVWSPQVFDSSLGQSVRQRYRFEEQ